MNLEITGKLIEKYDTQQVKDTFKKREFVLELTEEINGSPYVTFAKMQLVQAKCDILDRFQIGDNLRVNFNIKGNRYERDGKVNYFSNLDAWRIEKAEVNNSNGNNGGYNNGNNAGNGGNAGYNNGNGGFQNGNNSGNWSNGNNGNNGGFQNNNNSGNAPAYQNATSNAPAEADDLPF